MPKHDTPKTKPQAIQSEDVYKKAIPVLKQCDNVLEAYLFGSYARGDQNKKSDVDLYIVFSDTTSLSNLVDLRLDLQDTLRKKVHIVSSGGASQRFQNLTANERIKFYEKS